MRARISNDVAYWAQRVIDDLSVGAWKRVFNALDTLRAYRAGLYAAGAEDDAQDTLGVSLELKRLFWCTRKPWLDIVSNSA